MSHLEPVHDNGCNDIETNPQCEIYFTSRSKINQNINRKGSINKKLINISMRLIIREVMTDEMNERLDILNEDGTKTGLSTTKEECYQKGYWYRTVHIWIMNENKELLMQKRNPYKKTFPNLWALSCAGHVLAGETSKQSAIRELKEELDLDIYEQNLEYLFTIKREQNYENSTLRVFDDVYLLNFNLDIEHTKLQVEELTDIKYVYYEYLQTMLKNNDPDYVPYGEEHKRLFEILTKRFSK